MVIDPIFQRLRVMNRLRQKLERLERENQQVLTTQEIQGLIHKFSRRGLDDKVEIIQNHLCPHSNFLNGQCIACGSSGGSK